MRWAPESVIVARGPKVPVLLLDTKICILAGAIHQELARRNTVLLYAYLRRGPKEAVLGYIV